MSGLPWRGWSARRIIISSYQRFSYSTTAIRRSQIGRAPVVIPQGVSIQITDPSVAGEQVRRNKKRRVISVEGPLGQMSFEIDPFITVEYDAENQKIALSIEDSSQKQQLAMWGTTRAYLQNHILGVSEGHSAILRLVGVGYRATLESVAKLKQPEYPDQMFVNLKVGYSHPIEMGVPLGVKVTIPLPTRILIEGADKVKVTMFAAQIRRWRVPEPYKGKGIFVDDETIKLKAKKIK